MDTNIGEAQRQIDDEITFGVWNMIRILKIEDKIHGVEMQGSYAKGTDLPEDGSDLDLFIIFNTNISDEERERLGVEVGLGALAKYNPVVKDATSKYVECFFNYCGYSMEVQIIPIRHLTLEQIQSKTLNGEPITIGMERTPHQTEFMKRHLRGKEQQVRKLKQFMKDNGLYDSSMKSQGFSGYATECLIHYLDSFDNVVKYFADFKVGDMLGTGTCGKDNIFYLIDPIDPNRDLISAFNPVKIGRTIKVFQYYNKYGKVPKQSEPVEMDSITLCYETSEKDEDILAGQIRKTQKSIIRQMYKMGFDIPIDIDNVVDGFTVENPAMSIDRDENIIALSFGVENMIIKDTYKDKGIPVEMEKAIEEYKEANPNNEFIVEGGRVKAIKIREFTKPSNALRWLTSKHGVNMIQQSGVTKDMLNNGVTIMVGRSSFENLI